MMESTVDFSTEGMDFYEECTCDEIEWDDGECPYCSEFELE